jgi:hypothetical protein
MKNDRKFNHAHIIKTISELRDKIKNHSIEPTEDEIEFMMSKVGDNKELTKAKIEAIKTNELNKKNRLLKLLYEYI